MGKLKVVKIASVLHLFLASKNPCAFSLRSPFFMTAETHFENRRILTVIWLYCSCLCISPAPRVARRRSSHWRGVSGCHKRQSRSNTRFALLSKRPLQSLILFNLTQQSRVHMSYFTSTPLDGRASKPERRPGNMAVVLPQPWLFGQGVDIFFPKSNAVK